MRLTRLRAYLVVGLVLSLSAGVAADITLIPGFANAIFSGVSRFLGVVQLADGTAAVPSVGFASDADGTGTGIYRVAANSLGVSVNGTARLTVGANVITAAQFIQPDLDKTRDLGAPALQWREVFIGQAIRGSTSKTLTESSATAYVQIAVANSEVAAGRIEYDIIARDATNTQGLSGEVYFSAAATSTGTVTAAALSDQHILNPVTSGTLTNTTTQTTGTNTLTFNANAASSLTQTLLEIRYRVVIFSGTATVTPQ